MRNGALFAVLALVLLPAAARANTPEDVLGLGARAVAMGGAGTATSQDFSSVYYNPASLSFCPERSFSVSLSHLAYGLTLEAGPDDPRLETLEDQTRIYVGFCSDLPYGLAFGMLLGSGLQNPTTLDQTTLEATPQYLLYGESLEQLSIMLGLGWRLWDELAIGVGGAILINSLLAVDAVVPAISDEEVFASLSWDLQPTSALYVGARYQPIEQLSLAVTYRSALFHDLDASALVDVQAAGILLEVNLLLESAAWYSPQQVAIGGAVAPIPALTLTADVTWYDWSAHPGPFIIATPHPDDPGIAASLRYAPREDHGFRDAWVPRLGAEYRFDDIGVALRGGFSHRPAIVATPRGRANLLDAAVSTVAFGAGYRWGAQRPSGSRSAFGPMAGDGEGGAAGGAREPTGVNGRIDAYARLQVMESVHVVRRGDAEQEVLNDYRFGGNAFDLGVTLSVGWF